MFKPTLMTEVKNHTQCRIHVKRTFVRCHDSNCRCWVYPPSNWIKRCPLNVRLYTPKLCVGALGCLMESINPSSNKSPKIDTTSSLETDTSLVRNSDTIEKVKVWFNPTFSLIKSKNLSAILAVDLFISNNLTTQN